MSVSALSSEIAGVSQDLSHTAGQTAGAGGRHRWHGQARIPECRPDCRRQVMTRGDSCLRRSEKLLQILAMGVVMKPSSSVSDWLTARLRLALIGQSKLNHNQCTCNVFQLALCSSHVCVQLFKCGCSGLVVVDVLFTVLLPLPAEVNDERDTADKGHSTAQRCNAGQSQEVAHWARLQLLWWGRRQHIRHYVLL